MTINKKQILIPLELNGQRIDSAVHKLLPEYSRGKIQAWIKNGYITVDGQTISSKKKIIGGENLIIEIQKDLFFPHLENPLHESQLQMKVLVWLIQTIDPCIL